MNSQDLEKIKQDMKQQLLNNEEKIKELNNKIDKVYLNSTESKTIGACIFAIIPYIIIILGINIITNLVTLPNELIPYIPVILSLILGYKIDSSLTKKYRKNVKQPENEKLEQETNFRIEKENLKIKNEVIIKTYNKLNDCQRIIQKDIVKEYITDEKDKKEKILSLEKQIKEKEKELELKVTKDYLKKNYQSSISKTKRNSSILRLAILTGLVTVTLCTIPSLILGITYQVNNFLILGLSLGSIYGINKEINRKKVFNKINNKLGNNKIIPVKQTINYSFKDKTIDKLIKDLSTLNLTREQVKITDPKIKKQEKSIAKQNKKTPTLELIEHPIIYDNLNKNGPVRTRKYNANRIN